MNLVLRLALDLLPAAGGGRRRPMRDGYRASMWFGAVVAREGFAPFVTDAVLAFEDADAVAPGRSATARAWVLAPDELPRDLAPGRAFALVEGERTVARARLLELLEDCADAPLADLAAAKRRALAPRA